MPKRAVLWIAAAGGLVALALALGDVDTFGRRPQTAARMATPAPPPTRPADLRSYALELPELRGLAPGAPAGARLELWVTWSTPMRKRPRLERVTGHAVLERVVPPLIPGAPDTALLLVPESEIPDLLLADRYGSLSATLVPN
jgi:hypothetical protein